MRSAGPKRNPMSCFRYQVSQSAEVIGSSGEGKKPSNLVDPSQLHFPEHPHHLHPPERLLHSFSLPQTHLIPDMPRVPLVHRAPAVRIVLRHMRGNLHPAEFSHEFLRVVVFVSSQGDPLSAGNGLGHEHCCLSLRCSICLRPTCTSWHVPAPLERSSPRPLLSANAPDSCCTPRDSIPPRPSPSPQTPGT